MVLFSIEKWMLVGIDDKKYIKYTDIVGFGIEI